MKTLANTISTLTREEVIEAAQFFNRAIAKNQTITEKEQEALSVIEKKPAVFIEDLEILSRIILLSAAAVPQYQKEVQIAIDGIGKKQIVLGSVELITLAALGLIGLHIILSKGRSEKTEITEVIEKDGKTIRTSKNTKYEISSMLGSILKSYFGSRK